MLHLIKKEPSRSKKRSYETTKNKMPIFLSRTVTIFARLRLLTIEQVGMKYQPLHSARSIEHYPCLIMNILTLPLMIFWPSLEQWQRLKVHGMSLERYLGPAKMKSLKREFESLTGIPLKTMPRWLITEDCFKEQQEMSNKCGLAILIKYQKFT